MQEAADLLSSAQQTEDMLLSAMQDPGTPAGPAPGTGPAAATNSNPKTAGGQFAPPQQPKLLQRGPCYVELSHFALTGKGLKRPPAYACYCKATGAGVGLSINRTAMEFPGRVLGGIGAALGGRGILGCDYKYTCMRNQVRCSRRIGGCANGLVS